MSAVIVPSVSRSTKLTALATGRVERSAAVVCGVGEERAGFLKHLSTRTRLDP